MTNDSGTTEPDTERKRADGDVGLVRLALELPLLVVAAAVIALIVKALFAQAFYIPSESMWPQLTGGDRVIVSRTSYRLHEPRRGDIVVFDDPQAPPVENGGFIVFRLGREAFEALGVLKPDERELIKRVIGLPGETLRAVDGTIYVDDRPLREPYLPPTAETNDFGPVIVPEDHLFVMGDNRTNSKDSRRFGAIEEADVVGRAIARVWPPGRVAWL